MKKALSVTSPDHGMGLSAYLVLAVFGLVGVFNTSKGSSSVYRLFPPGMDDVWSTTLMISAGGSFIAALYAKRARRPDEYLRMEMLFSFALFVNLAYLLILAVPYFWDKGAFTIVFVSAFALGALARSVQIWFDRRRVRKARQAVIRPTTQVMADPRDDKSERG